MIFTKAHFGTGLVLIPGLLRVVLADNTRVNGQRCLEEEEGFIACDSDDPTVALVCEAGAPNWIWDAGEEDCDKKEQHILEGTEVICIWSNLNHGDNKQQRACLNGKQAACIIPSDNPTRTGWIGWAATDSKPARNGPGCSTVEQCPTPKFASALQCLD